MQNMIRRTFSPSFMNKNSTHRWMSNANHSASAFLRNKVGIEERLHAGILKALQTVYGKHIDVSHLKSFGTDGLKALAESVELELRQQDRKPRNRPSRTMHFRIPHHKSEFDLKWDLGDSILDLAKSPEGAVLLGEYMEGTCGGQKRCVCLERNTRLLACFVRSRSLPHYKNPSIHSCCTCHVYLDDKLLSLVPPPDKNELDMLDLAYEPRLESRLGCQITLTPDLLQKIDPDQPIVVTIPADVNNVWT